jgi:hypothetical protein
MAATLRGKSPPFRRVLRRDERSAMTTTPNEPVKDEDIETAGGPDGPSQMGLGDADGTDGGDADGSDSGDSDSGDADGGDSDSSDGGDADGTDA